MQHSHSHRVRSSAQVPPHARGRHCLEGNFENLLFLFCSSNSCDLCKRLSPQERLSARERFCAKSHCVFSFLSFNNDGSDIRGAVSGSAPPSVPDKSQLRGKRQTGRQRRCMMDITSQLELFQRRFARQDTSVDLRPHSGSTLVTLLAKSNKTQSQVPFEKYAFTLTLGK